MNRQSGVALIMALVALTIVAGVVLIVASQLQGLQISARHDARSAILASLADAAFAEALAHLSDDPNFTGMASRSYGRGKISSVVSPAGATSRSVSATAHFQGWTARIDAEVDVSTGPRVIRLRRSETSSL